MNFLDNIKNKIKKKINPEDLVLIDNSHLHAKHKSFDANKSHLKVIITSKKLREMDKILAHKEVFSILKDEMNNSIHALEIEIN
jgi:BolA family transcriptional regulator, general stress-responsive regulator|tara:strand:- start:875 stop:1126 length:252 start_codon:yes stop_codon:yes gene_type:complete